MKNTLLRDKKDIANWLRQYRIHKFKIIESTDSTYMVNANNVDLSFQNLTHIPVKFNEVSGYFDCSHNNLTDLYGAPTYVQGTFVCNNNQLVDLNHGPVYVAAYNCSKNNLQSLVGAPEKITGTFNCSHNQLSDLYGMPRSIFNLNCEHNLLTSINGIATHVRGSLNLSHNNLSFPIDNFPGKAGSVIELLDNPLLGEYQNTYYFEELTILMQKLRLDNALAKPAQSNRTTHKI